MNTKIFRTIAVSIIALFATLNLAGQESKTMYIMKDGSVDFQSAVSEIDSIIFYNPVSPIDPTKDPGVLINGVKWATRNVDAFGTFTNKPEDSGMFYQWNRKAAWAATGDVTDWDPSTPDGTTWTKANDPSPAGWHVPTVDEIDALVNTEYVTSIWTTESGVSGRKFTDKASGNSLFLPATGYRTYNYGTLSSVGIEGNYWSRTQYNSSNAYYLTFNAAVNRSYNTSRYGLSVRCVADVAATSISLDKTTLALNVGEDYTLSATVLPENATNKTVVWTSSDETKATVSTNGKVTAIAEGEITITAQTGAQTATCVVTISDPLAHDPGTTINGIKWATRNVGAPGKFAKSSTDFGMYYQWNRNIGWSSTDPIVNSNGGTVWNSTTPTGTTWEKANDPSPAGWRVPTSAEINALLNTTYVTRISTTVNGVNGYLFTDRSTNATLFLPAAGARNNSGVLDTSSPGLYWSSTQEDGTYAYCLMISIGIQIPNNRYIGQPIRCVAAE